MTVGEIIKGLETINPTFLVVMSTDAEGNNYSPVSAVAECKYTPETTWCGEVTTNVRKKSLNAIVLWPTG